MAVLPALLAQQQGRDPHVGYIFPAGGQRGQTFEVTVGGQSLGAVKDAVVSGSGVRITFVDVYKPLVGKRFAELQNIIGVARGRIAPAGTPAPKPASPAKPLTTGTSTPPALSPASLAKVVTSGTSVFPPPKPAISPPVLASGTSAAPVPKPVPSVKAIASGTSPVLKPAPLPISTAPGAPRLSARKAAILQSDADILRRAGVPEDDIKKFIDRRSRESDPKRQPNPQLADLVTLKVEIAPDAPTGPIDVRLATPFAISNPLTFCVDALPQQFADPSLGKTVDTATRVTLPVVLNGQILPGAVHHFSFQARRGQRLVISAQARDLIPYLADTVPGWFQPAVALYDARGAQVAYSDHFRFNPDPVLFYQVPADGLYLLEVRDALYRGREDFVYRVTVGQIPFITDIFPLGAQLGLSMPVQLSGWNLPTAQTTVPPSKTEGAFSPPWLSNGLATSGPLFSVDALPQCMQSAPAQSGQVQRVTAPVIVNGRIAHPGDIHTFAFPCRAGEKIVAEIYARRLNSPLDSLLKVVDSKNHQIAFNDDCEDKGAGLLTHCADSRLTFTATTQGLYYVQLTDAQGHGGPEYSYRLRISDPIPDFVLRVVPSGITARPGVTVPVTVYALRKDGFNGDISLALKAPGFILNGGRIPAGQDKARVTLTFPEVPQPKPLDPAIEGHALIAGRDIIRQAVPADDMIQAFMYHHMVPARQFVAFVSGTARVRPPITLASPQPMILKSGGTAGILVSMQGHAPFPIAQPQYQLSDPPDGITIQAVSPAANATAISFKADHSKVKPGLKGNLIVEAFGERSPPAQSGKPAAKTRWSLGFLPAIPFEIAGP